LAIQDLAERISFSRRAAKLAKDRVEESFGYLGVLASSRDIFIDVYVKG